MTEDGRARLREAALANQPWRSSTGPRTPEGKARSAANGRARQVGGHSVRAIRAELVELRLLAGQMASSRLLLAERLKTRDPEACTIPGRTTGGSHPIQ